ncbi:MAG: segregation ATPase FtsK/SpoIIIE, family, partial [Actinomycetota bacterium]|nr:segregation ATPase FtsK/SpoIIIE, family [Actinomycetota bacterium]
MATRTPTRAPRSSGPAAKSRSRPAARRPAARRTKRRRRAPARSAGGWPAPVRVLGSLLRGCWLGIAHVLGALTRRVGTSARELDPAHRRDGLGLALLGAATVVAAVEWWGLRGLPGEFVHAVVAGTLGRVGLVVPLALLALGVRLLRHPEDASAGGRIGIGVTALVVATAGLVHIA